MGELLVRAIFFKGRHPADAEGIYPFEWNAQESYVKVDEFLKKNAEPFLPEQVNYFPYIDEGFITPAVAASCYVLNNCIVGNLFRPYGGFTDTGVIHKMVVGGNAENLPAIKKTCGLIWEGGDCARWMPFWEQEKDRIIRTPGKLESIIQALPYMSKLLTE